MIQSVTKAGLKRLDLLARQEYGVANLAAALNTPNKKRALLILARTTGIELKRPFATPKKRPTPSPKTGARRNWNFHGRVDQARRTRAYVIEKRIYDELLRRRDVHATRVRSFEEFLRNNHSESNWFLTLALAVQPCICKGECGGAKSEASKLLLDAAKEAAGKMVDKGLEIALTPVVKAMLTAVPLVSGAPAAVVVGLSWFIVRYAKKGFCAAKIQKNLLTTLGLSGSGWENHS